MVRKYDLDLFHEHPSPAVRYIEGKRVRRILALLAAGARDSVVEVGCGAGHLLARVPSERVFGLDLSETLLARTAKRLGRDGVVVQGDAEHLPFRSGTWDRVYCSEVLEHVPNPSAAVAEIARVLRPTGVAVLSVPNETLINALKAVVRRCGLQRLIFRTASAGYAMPERMDDEWHLHRFDRRSLLGLIPPGLRMARFEGIPFRWLPLRYGVRCEPAEGAGGPGAYAR